MAAPRSASSERRPTWPSGAPCRRASRLRPRAGSGRRAPGALWLRQDLPREQGLEYWRGTHARIACETPGWLEYRQHHFDPDEPGLWPDLTGVETSIGKAGRMDGVAEVTFEHAASPLKGMRSRKAIFEDERNVFARTIAYMTGPSGGRWWREGRGEPVGFRTVVMVRRREGVRFRVFRKWVNDALGGALDDAPGMLEVRTQAFLPYIKQLWAKLPALITSNRPSGATTPPSCWVLRTARRSRPLSHPLLSRRCGTASTSNAPRSTPTPSATPTSSGATASLRRLTDRTGAPRGPV